MVSRNNTPNQPCGGTKEAYIDKGKDAVDLVDELQHLMGGTTDESYDPDLLDAYLDALDEKAPRPEPPSPQEAKERLRQRLRDLAAQLEPTPGETKPTAVTAERKRLHGRPFRSLITAAAMVALLIVGMMGAQASGVDVFGALAQWASQVFHLGTIVEINENVNTYNEIKRILNEYDYSKGIVPRWFPEDFVASEPEVFETNRLLSIQVNFSHSDGRSFFISFDRYMSAESIPKKTFEKDDTTIEQYVRNGKTFHISSNMEYVTAVWSEDLLVEMIQGDLSVQETKNMIDSIGVD